MQLLRQISFVFQAALIISLLAACASGRRAPSMSDQQTTGKYKIGQPYQINGNWYYPHEDYSYDETGIASWYGTEFQGAARTANGEIFNKDELTAAHKTLPLPTLARVTNLENGKSIVVRINDRGPFVGSRIIDVSQRTAQLLDFESQGVAKVRVQVLADESKAIADAMRRYGSSYPPAEVASAVPPQPETPYQQLSMAEVKPVQVVRQLEVTGANRIYVQAGAFSSMENAKKMQRQLSGVSKATITDALVNGMKFYRVRVGPLQGVKQADVMLDKMVKSGIRGARTVVE